MKRTATILTLAGVLGGVLAGTANGQTIDDFEAGAFGPVSDTTDDMFGEFAVQNGLPGTNVIGGQRVAIVALSNGPSATIDLDLAGGGDHGLDIELAPQSFGFVFLGYDGGDPNTGFGSVDLSTGSNDAVQVVLDVDPNVSGIVYIDVMDPNYAVAQFAFDASGTYEIPFSWFETSLNLEDARPHEGDFSEVSQVFVQVQVINGSNQPGGVRILSIGTGSTGACPGDINLDGNVDISDLAELLAQFGQTGSGLSADINDDGAVNLTDLAELLGVFGTSC